MARKAERNSGTAAGRDGSNRWIASGLLPALAGLVTLAVVMGIGRFAYTSLVPGMMHRHGIDEGTAGVMAAWNYAGYLAGVLLVRGEKPGGRRWLLCAAGLALSVLTTAGMGLVHTVPLWHAMRFASGLASGCCFVLASAIVLDALLAASRPVLAGVLYSGTGLGIVFGGVAAPLLEGRLGADAAWIVLGLLCVPFSLFAAAYLRPGCCPDRAVLPEPVAGADSGAVAQDAETGTPGAGQTDGAPGGLPGGGFGRLCGTLSGGGSGAYALLLVAYFLEGFGYIIGTTFLVVLIQSSSDIPLLADASWILTGLAAAASPPLWRMAARAGYRRMLIIAFVLQGAGVLLPVLSASPVCALAGGLLLGGTFMGITMLSLQYGVSLSKRPSAHTIAVMTALYGVGQILGPFVAGRSAEGGQGFGFAFTVSAAALFLAALLLAFSRTGKKAAR